ncbi:hypothetical protein KC887_00195 [Candidatus Kaiserbacteria bacterium]|nr:hypothetical protein [Candidatus Kaiserbacteria bacterium]
MAFDFFDTRTDGGTPSRMTIGKNGYLSFSVTASQEFELTKFKYCRLAYDAERKLIGFQFLTQEQRADFPGGFAVYSNNNSTTVRAEAFVIKHDLPYRWTMPVKYDEASDMVIADIQAGKINDRKPSMKKRK